MAEELDFSELNSTMAELNRMLVSLGPALFQLRGATLGGAEELDRLGSVSKEAASAMGEYAKDAPRTRKEQTDLRNEQAQERKKRREINQALEPYKKEVKYSTDAVQQGQRAQRDLTAAFRGFGSNVLADIILGKERFNQSKNLIDLEKVKLDNIAAEFPIVQQQLQAAQEKLQNHQAEMQGISDLLEARKLQADAARAMVQMARDEVAAAQENVKAIQAEVEARTEQLTNIRSGIEALQSQKTDIEAQRDAVAQQLAAQNVLYDEWLALQDGSDEAKRELAAVAATGFQLRSQLQQLEQQAASQETAITAMTAQESRMADALGQSTEALASAEQSSREASSRLDEYGDELQSAMNRVEESEAAFDRADKKLDTLTSAAESAASRLNGLADSAGDTAANLRNMKIEKMSSVLSGTTNFLGKVGGTLQSLGNGLRDFERRVGISAQNLAKMAFTEPTKAINLVKGKWQEMVGNRGQDYFDRMIEARDVFGDEFGGTLTGAAASKLASQARSMGVTVQELAKARRGFMTNSMGDLKGAVDAQNKFVAEFKKKGLNTKDAFQAVMQYTDIMARNGTRFAASFAKAAADAKKIGVDLKKVDAFGDSIISDYEGFLEKQSELGAMGFNFDSSKLAQISESGDTGALMNELRSQLASQGKDLTKMRRSEQLALSNAFGIPMEELLRMSQPKPEEGSREDQMAASGEKTAKHAERIDKATLNQNTELTGIGKVISLIAQGLSFISPFIVMMATMRSGKGAADVAGTLKALAEKATGGACGVAGAATSVVSAATPAAAAAAGPVAAAAEDAGASIISSLEEKAAEKAGELQDSALGKLEEGVMSKLPGGGGGEEGGGGVPEGLGGVNGSLGSKIADFGKGLGALGKGAGQMISGILKGIASGFRAFADPMVALGGLALAGIIATAILAIGAALAGATWLMGKALPTLSEGLMSFNQIDGMNLMKVGAGMTALAVGMTAFGVAMIAAAAGSFVSGLADLITPGKGIMEKLVEFSSFDIPLDKVVNNAKALVAYSLAMAAYGAGQIGNTVGAIAGAVASLFEQEPPMDKLQAFALYNIDKVKVENNASAMVSYAKAMAAYAGGEIGGMVGAVAGAITSLFDQEPPIEKLQKFASFTIDANKVKANAEAMKAFGEAMSAYKGSGEGMGSVISKGLASFFEVDLDNPIAKFKIFAAQNFGDPAKIKNNAEAFKAFAEAMSKFGGEGGGMFTDNLADKLEDLAEVDFTPLYQKYREFNAMEMGDLGKVKQKAEGFKSFAEAFNTEIEFEFDADPAQITAALSSFQQISTVSAATNTAKIKEVTTAYSSFIEMLGKLSKAKDVSAAKDSINILATTMNTLGQAIGKVVSSLAALSMDKINKLKDVFTPQFTAAFTASIVALANLYQGKKIEAGAITNPRTGGDVVSNSGYGERTLVTPSGPIALHNSDTVVAYANDMIANDGVRLLSKGALLNNQPQGSTPVNVSVDMGRLEQKLDAVVRAIGSMNVQMDGAKVGKVLVNAAEAGGQVGVFGQQSRATL